MHKIVKILKKIKIRNIIILIILLTFNTYAWFIYSTKVNMDITAHVSSWNIEFITDDQVVTTNLLIKIDRIFPGMEGEKKFEKIVEFLNQIKLVYE